MQISLQDHINSLSFFKNNFNKILHDVENNHQPFIITQNGKGAGIFIDIETWETMIKKIELLKKINEGEKSLEDDKTYTIDEVEEFLSKKYDL